MLLFDAAGIASAASKRDEPRQAGRRRHGCDRGERLGGQVARRCPRLLQQPWPAHEGRTAELRSKVRDLSEDPRVIELLAQGVSEHAARQWRQLQVQGRLRG